MLVKTVYIDTINYDIYQEPPEGYIDLGIFDLHEEIPEGEYYFEVDSFLAEAIIILNKKGYLTEMSCEGRLEHFLEDSLVKSFNGEKDPERVNNMKLQNTNYEIIHIDGNQYYFVQRAVRCWIRFIEGVKLPSLPEGFLAKYVSFSDRKCLKLYKKIPAYTGEVINNNGKLEFVKKDKSAFLQDVIRLTEELTAWANSLPDLTKNPAGKSV